MLSELSQTDKEIEVVSFVRESREGKLLEMQTRRMGVVRGRGVGGTGVGQRVPTSSYTMSTFCRSNIQHTDCSE